ncbi:phytanoyl-CoA dioxygenase family protein [Sphingomicrobium clamense]|uniref:Phytanoyl-CoA dioxygenase family protein n=1 Tax=Sphingomicrobium clamense TaxID=2851013 RepID=A0ABS6V331_9SPHN|nr:phytanoyl-CoA dioxygenase family protein [Sphingomicrobium sp. B8]MBW0143970.1 phytanoyl-CoA dioxygenase family protein [Sphingomicrobium sp. B8]
MTIFRSFARAAKSVLYAPAILTGASALDGAGPVASKRLNKAGLHRWRVAQAARLTASRRRHMESKVRPEWREQFARDGFVVVENAIAEGEFAALRDAILSRRWDVRDMVQGDTITRRAAIDPAMLDSLPALDRLLRADWFRWLLRYVSSFDVEPLYYLQSILKRGDGTPDPQVKPHADTFHSSMKAWLFLEDVAAGDGAFSYVRGSHRLTPERLAWHHEVATSLEERDRLTRRGSFRASAEDLRRMGLGEPEELAVKANTLVVADTFGFHARGPSGPDLTRVEIWAYSRRNPFLPWLGGDPLSVRPIAPRRVGWLWKLRDRFPKQLKQPWKPVGRKRMTDLP